MSDDIAGYIKELFEFDEETFIEFKEIYGFTFVFMTKIITINTRIASAEIKPAGIIFKENREFYFTPLCELDNVEYIVKEYVNQFSKNIHFFQGLI